MQHRHLPTLALAAALLTAFGCGSAGKPVHGFRAQFKPDLPRKASDTTIDPIKSYRAPYPTFGTIERHDPRFDKLVPKDAVIQKLAEGFVWSEGPVWVPGERYLLFNDIPPNAMYQWRKGEGIRLFMHPSGYTGKAPRTGEPGSNGLTLDPKGRLVMCQHGNRRVARLESLKHPGGAVTPLAVKYMDKRLNSPNDVVFHSGGDLYFTDPPYGLQKRMADPAKELDFQGVYLLRGGKPGGELVLLTKEVTRPNGLAFSPDEKTLYVASSDPDLSVWHKFPVKPDGTLGQGAIFFDATAWFKAGKLGLPDGLKVDKDGNVWATGPGGVHVFAPDGTLLGSINTGQKTANCAWGEDGSVLFITADPFLGRVQTSTKGAGW